MFLSDPRDTPVTFGTPASADPFSYSLHDFPPDPSTDLDAINKSIESFNKSVYAAERQTRLVDTINAHTSALSEAADNRIRTVRDVTGIQIENPFEGGYQPEAEQRIREMRQRGEDVSRLDGDANATAAMRLRIFHEKISAAAESHPDKAAALNFYQSLDDQARAISKNAAQDTTEVGFVPGLIGGLWGSRRDPLFIGSLFAGPGLSTAGSTVARIGWGAIKQGLFNAGLQATAQPAVQQWRQDIGEKNGVVPAMENVGMAFLFGAIPGAAIEGVRALSAAEKQAVNRIAGGHASAADVRTAAEGVGVKIGADLDREIKTGAADATNTEAAIGAAPRDVSAEQHADISAQATRYVDDPVNNPPPEIPIVARPRKADVAAVLDDTRTVAVGDRETVDGKPISFERFDPKTLTTDAAAFQYKGGGDAAGVTERLRGVTQWDPIASGKTLVFERADGARVIADGHQRLGLAKRLGEGDASIRLDGFLFRERDGWTPEDVRAMAAKKNMQEGSGEAIDAARVLRDRPDLLDGSMPISSPAMKNAVALSRLSDEGFGMALNGVVPPNYAAAVGAMVPDKLQHAGVIADLARFAPETEREARLLIGEIQAAGFKTEEQINLFGQTVATRSLMAERVKILDNAMQALVKDKKLFGTLASNAETIETAGNQLDRGSNDARARAAAQLQDLLTRLARSTGPVSDALNRAAALVGDGSMKPPKAAEAFLDAVRNLLDRDGLQGLLASPELKPAVVAEPGTKEALAIAEGAAEHRQALAPPEASLSPQTAVQTFRDFTAGQHGIPVQDLHARAAALQAAIATAGEQAAAASGAKFVNPGVKKLETLAEKMGRKGYEHAGQITDAARGGFVVATPDQTEKAIAVLAQHFELLDEGWKVGPTGYVDRKVLARGADGTVGEFQIIPAGMYEAKTREGHRLYKAMRALRGGTDQEEAQALRLQSEAVYSAAAGKLGADWAGILDRSSEPNSGSKVLRQSASDILADVPHTSAKSTGDQGAPGLRTANADMPDSTAGRQSQLQNVKDVATPDNVGASPGAGKPANEEPSLFDSVAVSTRDDGRDTRFITREQALAEADKPGEYADLVASCQAA